MHYFIVPNGDATIYEKYPNLNTGLDEILELRKSFGSDDSEILDSNVYESSTNTKTVFNSRILMKFDLTFVSESIANNEIKTPINCELNLYSSNYNGVPIEYTLQAFPLSSSWYYGEGKLHSDPSIIDGVSWRFKDLNTLWNLSGSDYISTVSASQTFNYTETDINMNVTEIVNSWISGSIENNGFIIKRPDENEQSDKEFGDLYYFSNETHTIYFPRLEIKWNDFQIDSGSLTPVTSSNVSVYMKTLRSSYKVNTKVRMRPIPKNIYESRSFDSLTNNFSGMYLDNFYYSILDAQTNLEIIPFSEYSRISCDPNGNYFDLWLSSFLPDRYYKLVFMIKIDGSDVYIDNNYTFKVVR
jgi:hypothetical protein